jgi:hypothetical protein
MSDVSVDQRRAAEATSHEDANIRVETQII